MRILGIDYGRRRFGLSLSDETQSLASPLAPLRRETPDADLRAIAKIVSEHAVVEVVVGLPINMDGSQGEMCDEVGQFVSFLATRLRLAVHTFDERMTSMEAERVLIQGNVTRKRRRELRDGLAAVLILQGFLDRRRNTPLEGSDDENGRSVGSAF